jgi:hypothetical protein
LVDYGYDRRVAWIVDSLKHPAEADLFRDIFGEAFYLVGVVADDSKRQDRMNETKKILKSAI